MGIPMTVWAYVKSYFLAFANPAEPWMWVFTVGWLFALLTNKQVRGHTHWLTYFAIPFFWAVWLLNKIPVFGKILSPVIGIWSTAMNYHLKLGSEEFTVRELTVGAIGCAILAGMAGGRYTQNPWWLWLGFVPIGTYGLYKLILFIAKRVSEKSGEATVKGAPKKLWAKIKPVAKAKPAELSATAGGTKAPEASQPLGLACPHCGAGNPVGYKACQDCGKSKDTTPSVSKPVGARIQAAQSKFRERNKF